MCGPDWDLEDSREVFGTPVLGFSLCRRSGSLKQQHLPHEIHFGITSGCINRDHTLAPALNVFVCRSEGKTGWQLLVSFVPNKVHVQKKRGKNGKIFYPLLISLSFSFELFKVLDHVVKEGRLPSHVHKSLALETVAFCTSFLPKQCVFSALWQSHFSVIWQIWLSLLST